MNLHEKNLRWIFFITLTLTLLAPALAPSWRLFFLIPFLITAIYQKSNLACLWYAFFCGLILDAAISQERFGLYALNYTIAMALLYPQKQHFFADSPSTLPIMTALFSMIATLIQAILMHGLERDLSISWSWLVTDLLIMPLLDGLFAFTLFVLPFALFGKKQKRGRDYFVES